MAQETLEQPLIQHNPADVVGLTPDQEQKAAELYQSVHERASQLSHTQANVEDYGSSHTGILSGDIVSGPSVISAWSGDIATGFRNQQLKSAERAAKRHFKKHEVGYQTQALKEAADAGVKINSLPFEEPKHTAKKRLGNAALAMVDGATAAALTTAIVMPVSTRDIIPGYLAYRFGKGAAVRGAAAVKGKGDTGMALANHVSVPLAVHGTKKQLHTQRQKLKY